MKNYTVYKHTSPNGKRYIGLTGRNVEVRWRNGEGYQTQDYFYKAINKYGWENIEHKIIAKNLSKEQAIDLEVELIAKYDTTNPVNGYNLTTGGEFTTHNDKARKNMSEGQKLANDTRKNSKITYAIADAIRHDYKTGKYNQIELAEKYDITPSNAGRILRNEIWTDEDYKYVDYGLLRAREIRKDYATENYSQRELAEKYKLTISMISLIVNNKQWVDEDYKYIDYRLIRARKIRKDFATGKYLQLELAEKYKLTIGMISSIVNNKSWAE